MELVFINGLNVLKLSHGQARADATRAPLHALTCDTLQRVDLIKNSKRPLVMEATLECVQREQRAEGMRACCVGKGRALHSLRVLLAQPKTALSAV